MKLNRKANDKWIIRIVLLASIISALAVIFLMTKTDAIVKGQLYGFGLEYNRAWAKPYNLYMQLMYVGVGVPIALSAVGIALTFKKTSHNEPEISPAPKPSVHIPKQAPVVAAQPEPEPQPAVSEEPKMKEKEKEAKNGGSGMVISCPNCKKVFSRPLVMLNFEGGKTRLMNVCPYCNHVLGSAEDEKSPEQDFQVADTDKKLIH